MINFGNTWEPTDAQVEKGIHIDLIGTRRTDKYAARYMFRQGFGRINISPPACGLYDTPQAGHLPHRQMGRAGPDQDPGQGGGRHRASS